MPPGSKHVAFGWWRATISALVLVGVLAACTHLYALQLQGVARDLDRPIHQRLAAARRARLLEPFNDEIAVTAQTLSAQRLLRDGMVDEAYMLLLPLSRTVRDDELFRSTYQAVLAVKLPLDTGKAHQQHAREKEGGELDPADVIK